MSIGSHAIKNIAETQAILSSAGSGSVLDRCAWVPDGTMEEHCHNKHVTA